MKFYNKQREYYCGSDVHPKTMNISIQDKNGELIVHAGSVYILLFITKKVVIGQKTPLLDGYSSIFSNS